MDRDQGRGLSVPDRYERFLEEESEESTRVERLVDEGRACLERGESERARILFIKALSIFPWVPPALANLAALALQRDEFDQAFRYLSDLFEHFPYDPAGNGVAIRYWLRRGSSPMAYLHARRALNGLKAMADEKEALRDPSLLQRASIILLSTFSAFEADDLICDLYALHDQADWDATSRLTFGIAFYNRGDLGTARTLWSQCDDSGPVMLYRMLLDLVDAQVFPPFRLDYHLSARMPTLDELQQVLHVNARGPLRLHSLALIPQAHGEPTELDPEHMDWMQALRYAVAKGIPSLAVLDGVHQILYGCNGDEGSEEQAELALSILLIDRWPHLGELLRYVSHSDDLPLRVRLTAALYMLWTEGKEAAKAALDKLKLEAASEFDQLLAHIVRLQVALIGEDVEEARNALHEAQHAAERVGDDAEEWMTVLSELTTRFHSLAKEHGAHRGDLAENEGSTTRTPPDNVILFPTGKERGGRDTAGS